MVLEIFAAGFIGGIIRALVGLSKYISATPAKKRKFRTDWLVVSLLSSGGLGLLAGVFIADDVRFALLAGYAGTDFVEGIFKIKMKSSNLGLYHYEISCDAVFIAPAGCIFPARRHTRCCGRIMQRIQSDNRG